MVVWLRFRRRCSKYLERLHKLSRQGPDTLKDSVRQGLGGQIAGGEHFQTRVEIVDVMECHCFRSLWINRRSELLLAMVRTNQMQQVQTHVFRWRGQILPRIAIVGGKFSPQRIHQFESDRYVSD